MVSGRLGYGLIAELDLETSNTGRRCQKKTASGREIFRARTFEPVERQLVLGAEVNAGGRLQKTPVEISGQSGRLALVEMLPCTGADLNQRIRHGGDLLGRNQNPASTSGPCSDADDVPSQ